MKSHRYKTKYGIHPTLEITAKLLGISIERAEDSIIRNTGEIKVVSL
jgi:hypothetical protein